MMSVDQIEAGDKLIDELGERDVAISIRDLVESLASVGLVLATAAPSEIAPALAALDRMDQDG